MRACVCVCVCVRVCVCVFNLLLLLGFLAFVVCCACALDFGFTVMYIYPRRVLETLPHLPGAPPGERPLDSARAHGSSLGDACIALCSAMVYVIYTQSSFIHISRVAAALMCARACVGGCARCGVVA